MTSNRRRRSARLLLALLAAALATPAALAQDEPANETPGDDETLEPGEPAFPDVNPNVDEDPETGEEAEGPWFESTPALLALAVIVVVVVLLIVVAAARRP